MGDYAALLKLYRSLMVKSAIQQVEINDLLNILEQLREKPVDNYRKITGKLVK